MHYSLWNLGEGISEGTNASPNINQVEADIAVQSTTSTCHWWGFATGTGNAQGRRIVTWRGVYIHTRVWETSTSGGRGQCGVTTHWLTIITGTNLYGCI